MKIWLKLLIIFMSVFLLGGCNGGDMEESRINYKSIKDIPTVKWEQLDKKQIFFGHQSVGNNILDGIRDIMKEVPAINFNIMEVTDKTENTDWDGGVFAHSKIGKNGDPQAKIDEFVDLTNKGIGNNSDLAFFKFCYVDVDKGTDIQKLFDEYKSNMAELKNNYPNTTFVHFTVPLLKKNKASFKKWIKDLLGRNSGFFANEHNIQRNRFNNLIVDEYSGKEPVFDLAKLESTYPDGSRETFTEQDKPYYSLVPDYTDDGGHLNSVGRKIVAEQLLLFLANQ